MLSRFHIPSFDATALRRVTGVGALLAAAACAASPGPPDPVQADIAWVAEGEFCEPETVLPMPDDTLLVSNVCGFQTTGDGFLSLLDADGDVIDWRVVEGLDSPLGMAFHDDHIYVVDANRLKSFTWPGFDAVDDTPTGARVANDVAVSPDGAFFVSDTAAGRVYTVTPGGVSAVLRADIDFAGANGVHYGPDGALYVGGARLWRVDVGSGQAEPIGPAWLSDIDGIEFEPTGVIQVTPVGGALIRLFPDGRTQILGGDGVSSANHGYAEKLKLVLIPTGYDNTVIAIRLPQAR